MRYIIKKIGGQRFPQREPVILDPVNWNREEWAALCKLFGLPATQTERIVAHIGEIEAHVSSGKRPAGDRHACKPEAEVDIVVKDGQVSEVYVGGAATRVTVLDLDTDDPLRWMELQRKYAVLLAKAKAGKVTDIL